MATDLRPARSSGCTPCGAGCSVTLRDELVEDVRQARSGRAARGSGAAPRCSPRRLIQTFGIPSSAPARCRGSGSRRRGRSAPGRRACEVGELAPVRGAPACRTGSRRRRPSRRTATPSSAFDASIRSRSEFERIAEPPAALAQLPERRGHLGERLPRGQRVGEPVLLAGRRAEPAHRLGHHLAVGQLAVVLQLGLELVVAGELRVGLALAEDARRARRGSRRSSRSASRSSRSSPSARHG